MRELHTPESKESTESTEAAEATPDKRNVEAGIEQKAQAVGSVSRAVVRSPWFAALARLGFAARGLVYLVIGWLALLTAIRAGGQTTDPQGAITDIYQQSFGKALLVVIVVGFIGYALWQFASAALNLDGEGDARKDAVRRIAYAIVGAAYLGFALAALRLLLRHTAPQGSNASTQDWTARLLAAPFGAFLVVLLGLIILGVAVALFFQAWKLSFERHFPLGQMREVERKLARYSGRFGIGALGAVFIVIGLFLISAALHHNPQQAQGVAGALATLAAQPFGPLLLGLVALGLVAYGVYGFVEARYRRIAA